MDRSQVELLKNILNATEKHPNAKVSKLIKGFEVERTPQNIALLLIELAEHPEFSIDTSISLKYYLNCFGELDQEPSFAEAGIVLFNSSRIYAKRVDYIHQEIERLIISLGNVENNQINASEQVQQIAAKVKRATKRTLEQINGPFEADMIPKRFKMLSSSKRFESVITKFNNALKNTLGTDLDKSMKTYIPQSTWQHSIIEDFDYEDEVDSKKNYKLFTYHLEHRYNTLIMDINFKMYFKIKDFIGEPCNDNELPESWPPLSDAYIEQYLNLEDVILIKEGHLEKNLDKLSDSALKTLTDNLLNKSSADNVEGTLDSTFGNNQTQQMSTDSQISLCENNLATRNFSSDSGIELDTSALSADPQNSSEIISIPVVESQENLSEINLSARNCSSDSGIELETSFQCHTNDQSQLSLLENNQPASNGDLLIKTSTSLDILPQSDAQIQEKDPTLLDPSNCQEDFSTLKLILPHISDQVIYLSDLDEVDRQMLTPKVVAQDVFGCVKDKSNIVIKIDDSIEQLFSIKEPMHEFCSLPLFERPDFSLQLNILKIPVKHFKKRRRFKLGPEFDLPKKERLKKYIKRSSLVQSPAPVPRKWIRIGDDSSCGHVSPPSTPSYEPDCFGFPEDSLIDKSRTLSRDSGISLHQAEDFVEPIDLLSSNLNSIALDVDSTEQQTNTIEILPILNEPSVPAELDHNMESSENIPQTNEPPDDITSNDNMPNEAIQIDNKSNELDELNEESHTRTKVHEWHTHLQPILACSRERHHFDVFAIGTEIMTQFDRTDIPPEKVSLENVMEHKDKSQISRYFLSMLLLANQGNIQIDVQNKNPNQPSDLQDIRLKLMSRKRNIVSLEDNIGLRTPTTASTSNSTTQINEQSEVAVVRTYKSVPEVPKMDDRDSGVAMSEDYIA